MSSDSETILYNEFGRHLKAARQTEKAGEYGEARKHYGLACKALLELAEIYVGETRSAYMSRVDAIIDVANSLPGGDASNKILQEMPNNVAVHAKIGTISAIDTDETLFTAATIPGITFDDVVGLDNVKRAIDTRIIKPRQYPEVYKALKKSPGGGVLMYGPPGTGKTMIAKAIANKVGAVFFDIKCSQIAQKYFGVAERNIRNLFETARQHEVAIIFFDEFESLGTKRDGSSTVMNRLVPELLSQIDGFTSSFNTLLVIAATNRPMDIDSAFLRPGRFSELLYIDLPDEEARKHILHKEYADVPIEEGIDFDDLARYMERFNGADVVEFCNRSKDLAADRCIENYEGDLAGLIVTKNDIEHTKKLIQSSVQEEELKVFETFKKQFQRP